MIIGNLRKAEEVSVFGETNKDAQGKATTETASRANRQRIELARITLGHNQKVSIVLEWMEKKNDNI